MTIIMRVKLPIIGVSPNSEARWAVSWPAEIRNLTIRGP